MKNFAKSGLHRLAFLKYFSLLKDAKTQFLIAVISGILYGFSSGFGIPVILKIAAEKVFSREDLSVAAAIWMSFAPVLAMSARATFSIINSYFIGYCGQTILQGLRVKIFDKIQRLPLDFFKKTEPFLEEP